MNEKLITFLKTELANKLPGENFKEIIDCKDSISYGKIYRVFHPDVCKNIVSDSLLKQGYTAKEAYTLSNEVVSSIIPDVKNMGYKAFDKWAIAIESESCMRCPAYQWVVHREGKHQCRLGVEITEKQNGNGKWNGRPQKECIRPMSVGASYLIARELDLPDPMVGKLDRDQYDQYCEERDRLCP